MQYLDLPPVWLAVLLALTYLLHLLVPTVGIGDAGWGGPDGLLWLGGALALLGILLMAAAIWEFQRARTTVMPRATPSAFLQRGIYQFTRNPIYLGDALVLIGAILWWDVPLALPLVPLFIILINKRFIEGEEAGLRALYGAEFDAWAAKVRRWV